MSPMIRTAASVATGLDGGGYPGGMAGRLFAVAAAVYAAAFGYGASVWPARVPLHFGADGRATSYGPRPAALLLFAGVGVGLVALVVGCVASTRRTGLDLVNVPHADYWKATPQRVAELRRRIADDVRHVGAATLLFLAALLTLVTSAAVDGSGRLSGWWVALLVGYLGYVAGWTVWLVTRRYDPGRAPAGPSRRG